MTAKQDGWIVVTVATRDFCWNCSPFCDGIVPGNVSDSNFDVSFDLPRSLVTRVVFQADQNIPENSSLFDPVFLCFPNLEDENLCQNQQAKHLVAARLLNSLASDARLSKDLDRDRLDAIKNWPRSGQRPDSEFELSLATWLNSSASQPHDGSDLKSVLSNDIFSDQDAIEVASISFSPSLLLLFLQTVLKLYLRIFVVLEGNTGIGKTRLITLIRDLIRVSNAIQPGSCPWVDRVIDFHSGLTQTEVERQLQISDVGDQSVLIFLDKVNTSSAGRYALNLALSHSQFSFIAAINQLEEMDSNVMHLIRCGIPQKLPQRISGILLCQESPLTKSGIQKTVDRSKLSYNVLECPIQVSDFIINVEPHSLPGSRSSKFLTSDEKQIIGSLIHFSLLSWHSSYIGQDATELLHWIEPIKTILEEYLCRGFEAARLLFNTRPILSFRDVVRVTELFKWVFHCLSRAKPVPQQPPGDQGDGSRRNRCKLPKQITISDCVSVAIVISIFLGFFLRFSPSFHVRQEENSEADFSTFMNTQLTKLQDFLDQKPDNPKAEIREFVKEDKVDDKLIGYKIHLRQILIEAVRHVTLSSVQQTQALTQLFAAVTKRITTFPDEWEKETVKFGFYKCYKYVEALSVAKLPVLLFHLLLIKAAAYAFRHHGESSMMSVLLISAPGMSKSLAANLYANYYTRRDKAEYESYMSPYQCSRSSETMGLEVHLRDAAEFLLRDADSSFHQRICVLLEEIWLGNFNSRNPLTVLHAVQDKGIEMKPTNKAEESIFVRLLILATSDSGLDFAIHNQSLLHFSGVPEDAELEHFLSLPPEAFRDLEIFLREKPKRGYFDVLIERVLDSLVNVKATGMLSDLWNHFGVRRPKIIPMRAVYGYFQACQERSEFQKFYELVGVFETAIDRDWCASDSITREEKLFKIASELYNKATGDKNSPDKQNSILLLGQEMAKSTSLGELRKSILIRTKACEAVDLIPAFVKAQGLLKSFHFFFPEDHRRLDDDSVDLALDEIFRVVLDQRTEMKWFVIVGNTGIADSLLDLLNIEHPENENWSPLLVYRGYPIHLLKCPNSIRFIFIVNDEELRSNCENPVLIPLLDRLIHLTIDKELYDLTRAEFSDNELMTSRVFQDRDDLVREFEGYVDSDFTLVHNYLKGTDQVTPPVRDSLHQNFSQFFDWLISRKPQGDDEIPRGVVLTATPPMVQMELPANARIPEVQLSDGNSLIVIEFPEMYLSDSNSFSKHLTDELKEVQNSDVILVIRSSLFLIDNAFLALETDRRYRFLLNEIAEPQVKLAVIVYSLATNNRIVGLDAFSGWPVVWVQEWIPSSRVTIPLETIATALKTQSFDLRANLNLFVPLVQQALESIEKSLPRPKTKGNRINVRNPKGARAASRPSPPVDPKERLLPLLLDQLAKAPRPDQKLGPALRDLAEQVLDPNAQGVDLASSFFAIVSNDVISNVFRLGMAIVQLRMRGSLASQVNGDYLVKVFDFVQKHSNLVPSLDIVCRETSVDLADELFPFELLQPIIQKYVVEVNVDSILPFTEYLEDLQNIGSGRSYAQFQKICRNARFVEGIAESVLEQGIDMTSLWSIMNGLLCYRGAGWLGCSVKVPPRDRYAICDPDTISLFQIDAAQPFSQDQMRPAFWNDFSRGDLVMSIPRSLPAAPDSIHAWVLAHAFRYSGDTFQRFCHVDGGPKYNVGGNNALKLLACYASFSSAFFNAAEHWQYIKTIINAGSNADNKSDFAEFLTEPLQVVCVALNYVEKGTQELEMYDCQRIFSELSHGGLKFQVPQIRFLHKPIAGFDGEKSDGDFWMFLSNDGRLNQIREKTANFGRPPHGIDFSVSVLEWIKKHVFVRVGWEERFFDRQLEWFFDTRENLLVRQLYAVLSEGQLEDQWKVLTWLMDPWGRSDPDITGKTCARFFWNHFRDSVLKSAPGVEIHALISAATKKALEKVENDVSLRVSSPWAIGEGKVQTLEAQRDGIPITMPSFIEHVVYSLAMFHFADSPSHDANVSKGVEWFFGFLRNLPRIGLTESLPALSELVTELKTAFASQLNLAYVLLRICSTCTMLAEQLNYLQTLEILNIPPDNLQSLTAMLANIDKCFNTSSNAYERLSRFTHAAVDVHNCMVVNADGVEFTPFASVTRNDVFPHINVENTLLQIMAENLFAGVDIPLDSYNAGLRIIECLTMAGSLWFLGDEDKHNPLKQIKLPGNPTQIFGIDEAVFTTSVKGIECTNRRMKLLYDHINAHPPEGPREPWFKRDGVMVALVMLEEVSNDNLMTLKKRFKDYCQDQIHRVYRNHEQMKAEWVELERGVNEQQVQKEPQEAFWSPSKFWDIDLEKALADLKLPK